MTASEQGLKIPDEVLGLVHSRGMWETLEDDEAEALWLTGAGLEPGSSIVEIGCQLGRSSVLFQSLAVEFGFWTTFIDPWDIDNHFALEWFQAIDSIGGDYTLHSIQSQELPRKSIGSMDIEFLYIDGDHREKGLMDIANSISHEFSLEDLWRSTTTGEVVFRT